MIADSWFHAQRLLRKQRNGLASTDDMQEVSLTITKKAWKAIYGERTVVYGVELGKTYYSR